MDDENKELPVGWGDNDDDNYDSPWGSDNSSIEENSVNIANTDTNDESSIEESTDNYVTNIENTTNNIPKIISENTVAKSQIATVLIIIIAVLVLIIGILAGMFFIQGKDDKSNNDNSASENNIVESTPVETITTTEGKNGTEATTVVQTTENPTEKETKVKESKDDIVSTYKKAIESKIDDLKKSNKSNAYVDFTLYDMDYDGSPELLIKYGDIESNCRISIYTFEKDKLKEITDDLPGSYTSFGYDYVANQIVLISAYRGQGEMSWYDLDNRGNFRFLISTGSLDINGDNDYEKYLDKYNVTYLNGSSISCSGNDNTTRIYSYDNGKYDYSEYSGINYKFLEDNLSGNFTNPKYSKPEKPKANNSELGKMYNLFYFEKLCVDSEGFLEDINGDGIEDLIYKGYGAGYLVYTYRNGKLTYEQEIMSIDGMKTPLLSANELKNQCKNKAAEYGFSLNSNFTVDSGIIGYINTQGGTLNLRSEPSTNSEVITEIPYGTFFNIYNSPYGYDLDWPYIGVTVNGSTYYGYVSGEYISYRDLGI